MNGLSIHITGVAQGVDFRPHVYNLATRLGLNGWVRNTSAGVDIELEGEASALDEFVRHLRADAPPLAHLDQVEVSPHAPNGYQSFKIEHSESLPNAFQPISPDVSICADCLRELFDSSDRRYRYPFINCAHCGPRFTIIQDIPYERPKTSMSVFPLCPDCEAEYTNPASRRFQARPLACPECGPRVWLEEVRTANPSDRLPVAQYTLGEEAIVACQRLLREGKIVAVKGLGGFRLACDALNTAAVGELRARKLRVDKPFALMMPNLTTVEQHCYLSPEERTLLESPARPIVLLRRRPESMVAEQVAPGQNHLGVMLPSTPLHYLLFSDSPSNPAQVNNLRPLVMTRANLADEPICTDNVDARLRLSALADAFLMHDRDIHIRTDDSVMRILPDFGHYPIRRSRGYAPFPVHLPWQSAPLLATGAQSKNTFCLANGDSAILSHYIGDLETPEALKSFESGIAHFEKLFRFKPAAIACDLHPGYLASRYAAQRAERENLALIPVQHQHAHIAALMAEHGLDGSEPVIGVAFDGSGYGDDGAIWGGEFLLVDYAGYKRFAHLRYFPLPAGGDAATRRPSRMALGLLHALGLDWDESLPTHTDLCYEDRTALRIQLEHNLNSPLTSSVGHLFTAAAALAGVREQASYEAQAAIEFEALADPDETGLYPFEFAEGQIDPSVAISALLADVLSGKAASQVSARFLNGLAHLVRDVCTSIRVETSVSRVALSGGVWQNVTLLMKTIPLLQQAGFQVYFHHKVPANDSGLALGQAVIANRMFMLL